MANLDQGAVVSFCPSKETLKNFLFLLPLAVSVAPPPSLALIHRNG
jgi:hypothetical protein